MTTLSMIVTQMLHETDPQILNYVLTLFDKYANSSYDDCKGSDAKARRVAARTGCNHSDGRSGLSSTVRETTRPGPPA